MSTPRLVSNSTYFQFYFSVSGMHRDKIMCLSANTYFSFNEHTKAWWGNTQSHTDAIYGLPMSAMYWLQKSNLSLWLLVCFLLLYSTSVWACVYGLYVDAWLTHHHPASHHHCTKNCSVPFAVWALAGSYPREGERHQSHRAGEEEEDGCKKRKLLPRLVCSNAEHLGITSLDPRSDPNHHRLKPTLREEGEY